MDKKTILTSVCSTHKPEVKMSSNSWEKTGQLLKKHEPKLIYLSIIVFCVIVIIGLYFYGDVPVVPGKNNPNTVEFSTDKSVLDDLPESTQE